MFVRIFSVKYDLSFGVLLFEIVYGKWNGEFFLIHISHQQIGNSTSSHARECHIAPSKTQESSIFSWKNIKLEDSNSKCYKDI